MLESLINLMGGFQTALTPINLLFCLGGVAMGMFVGVLPGLGPVGRNRPADPHDLRSGAGHRHHHAGRHLLRRHVRRHHYIRSDQHPRRGRLRHHLYRRLPDGPVKAGPVRPSA